MEKRLIELVCSLRERIKQVNALLDSRIAEVINLFRSGFEGENQRVGDGPSSIGNQVINISIVLIFLIGIFGIY